MRSTLLSLGAIAALSVASARCPNACSGRGRCGPDEVCLCFPGFTGPDCSERACPETEAWAVNSEDGAHSYAECANRGTCNRGTGECNCFPGFTGRACERMTCPGGCSGHGVCRVLNDLPNYVEDATITWDEKSVTACVCDGGWFGPDCSYRVCPFGDDPVTDCEQDKYNEQIQQINVTLTLDFTNNVLADKVGVVGDEFYLSFVNYASQNFSTRRIEGLWGDSTDKTGYTSMDITALTSGDSDAEKRIESALESLPNFAIRDVTVTHVGPEYDSSRATNSYKVTFHHLKDLQNSYGVQGLLTCHQGRVCPGPGCQPRVRQSYALAAFYSDGAGSAFGSLDVSNLAALGSPSSSAQSWVRFHRDSVLQCPVGKTCSGHQNSNVKLLGGIYVVHKGADIYVRVHGSSDSVASGMIDFTDATSAVPKVVDVSATSFPKADGFSFAGSVTAMNKDKFDITAFIPNTFLEFHSAPSAGSNGAAAMFFEPVSCSVKDITEDGKAFANLDAENMECSGRGECNRNTGECECFDGHTGVACERQTTVV